MGAVVVLVGAAGVAYASIPDGSGIIHGCVAKKDGSLRVIDPAAGGACNASKETALDWNQPGPAGSPGPSGQPGPAGTGAQLLSGTIPPDPLGVPVPIYSSDGLTVNITCGTDQNSGVALYITRPELGPD